MAKLSKMEANAIINKLNRDYNSLRNSLIEEAAATYTPSKNVATLVFLIKERDNLESQKNKIMSKINDIAHNLGITIYAYHDDKDVLSIAKKAEIANKFPKINLEAALDDLIIESIKENFDATGFIKHYLKQIKNG